MGQGCVGLRGAKLLTEPYHQFLTLLELLLMQHDFSENTIPVYGPTLIPIQRGEMIMLPKKTAFSVKYSTFFQNFN